MEHARPGYILLCKAIEENNANEVQNLLNAGVDPNEQGSGTQLVYGYHPGFKPLPLALFHARPPIIDLLLKAGADPNARLSKGCPLHPPLTILGHAINKDNFHKEAKPEDIYESIELLLKAGANPNTTTRFHGINLSYVSSLEFAICKLDYRLTNLLLQYGADPCEPSHAEALYGNYNYFLPAPIDLQNREKAQQQSIINLIHTYRNIKLIIKVLLEPDCFFHQLPEKLALLILEKIFAAPVKDRYLQTMYHPDKYPLLQEQQDYIEWVAGNRKPEISVPRYSLAYYARTNECKCNH
jgi:ankyrin repeat protein